MRAITLLYGCEAWTVYRRHIKKLDQFHMRCLRTIAHIKWQEHVPNTEVLKRCCINGMEALLQMSQLRWCGHVIRMDDSRIPKQTFYGQLHHGSRRPGGQYKRYKDRLKDTIKQCEIKPSDLESPARDRTTWRTTCRNAVQRFEEKRVDHLVGICEATDLRKTEPPLPGTFRCSTCGRMCQSMIGLFSHNRTHRS